MTSLKSHTSAATSFYPLEASHPPAHTLGQAPPLGGKSVKEFVASILHLIFFVTLNI